MNAISGEVTESFSQVGNDSVTDSDEDSEGILELGNGINIYKAKGKARGENKYFRYSYKSGGKTHHCHIPGGSTKNATARERAIAVLEMVKSGNSPQQVVEMIKSWTQK